MRNRSVAISYNGATLALTVLLLVTFVAFLGMTLFNTKGEPREALVAVSILNDGNWILPECCGTDLPYKPPMLAWCIAALGWLNGGHVTEFLSRLPSALAAVAMLICVFRFLASRTSLSIAAVTVLVCATTFELHRAATSCRVDMLFTAFIVMAILAMCVTAEKHPGRWRLPLGGILLMSLATLTKGPAGMLLPCGVLLVMQLMRGGKFLPTFTLYAVSGLLALILPAAWYLAAYQQGGDSFLQLAIEENFGRFLGKMSYESHEHTFFYNFQTLATGIAPYILLLLISLFAVRRWKLGRESLKARWSRLRALPGPELLAVVASVVIFVFYCIPKSKRSVYLLPMYPFVAYGITIYIRWIIRNCPRVLRTYGAIMASVGVLAAVALIVMMTGVISADPSSELATYLSEAQGLGAESLLMICVCLAVCLMTLRSILFAAPETAVQWTVLDTLIIYWMFSAAIQPMVLNPKSDRPMAAAVATVVPADEPLYGFMTTPMLRYYTAGFYTRDRIKAITHAPAHLKANDWVIAGESDVDSLERILPQDVVLAPVMEWPIKSCDNHQVATLYHVEAAPERAPQP